MKKLMIILCLALSASLAGLAYAKPSAKLIATVNQDAETFRHKEAGVEFQIPKGWKAAPSGDNITVASADDALQVVLWVPDEDTFEAAVKDLDKELGKTVKSIKTTSKPSQDTHNGMPHYGESGTGEVEGVTIAWSVDVLAAKKPLIILTFAAPNLFDKHAAEYAKLISSIKKSG